MGGVHCSPALPFLFDWIAMTNNIVSVSQVDLWSGLWNLFLLFIAPWVVVFGVWCGVKVILKAFKHVAK